MGLHGSILLWNGYNVPDGLSRAAEEAAGELDRRKVDALVVTHPPNVRYLCGFTGSAGVLLVARRPVFVTDGRYAEQAASEVPDARVSSRGAPLPAVAGNCAKLGLKRVAIESEHLTVARIEGLGQALGKGVKLVRLAGAVEALRAQKDAASWYCAITRWSWPRGFSGLF